MADRARSAPDAWNRSAFRTDGRVVVRSHWPASGGHEVMGRFLIQRAAVQKKMQIDVVISPIKLIDCGSQTNAYR
jgi:hypothetical protein